MVFVAFLGGSRTIWKAGRDEGVNGGDVTTNVCNAYDVPEIAVRGEAARGGPSAPPEGAVVRTCIAETPLAT